ncbi:hypothetical protein QOT17_010680 [Balamuthia mandrillaris]
MAASLRVAVVGAGPGGLCTAAIASRAGVNVHVFERRSLEADQGTGFDVSVKLQAILARGGITASDFARISRPGSDTFRVIKSTASQPEDVFCHIALPPWLSKLLRVQPAPETNRQAMQAALVGRASEAGASIRFGCTVGGARAVTGTTSPGSSSVGAELLDDEDNSLGVYDVVVDASGFGSRLRALRIAENADKEGQNNKEAHYTGYSMVHGIISDPETQCDPDLVRLLGQGTLQILGPRGRNMMLQRFGAALEDRRTSLYYGRAFPTPNSLAEAINIDASVLRNARGALITDGPSLKRIKEWIHDDMKEAAARSSWKPMYYHCVETIQAAALRPFWLHPSNPSFRPESDHLPLVLMGDALHTVPPYTGEGGQLALADAADVADFLIRSHNDNKEGRRHGVPVAELRELERKLLKRVESVVQQAGHTKAALERLATFDSVEAITLKDYWGNPFLASIIGLVNKLH